VIFGGIEAGGTKWIVAVGGGPDDIKATARIPTANPRETIARVAEFFAANPPVAAVGLGSFGPIDLRPGSPTWGCITTTPKPGWPNTSIVSMLEEALDVPVAVDTDVNAAALGEHVHGVARGLDTFCYVTIGTGIGGGGMSNGQLMHGLMHPEFGHIRIPHDRDLDPFGGICPYHGDCFEGLASGEAIRARWGSPAEEISEAGVWELEAHYLALGLVNVICTLSPERVALGGGVMKQPGLLNLVRAQASELLAGYMGAPELDGPLDGYLVAPALGEQAGVVGSLELARRLVTGDGVRSAEAEQARL
jgi:fructokinase